MGQFLGYTIQQWIRRSVTVSIDDLRYSNSAGRCIAISLVVLAHVKLVSPDSALVSLGSGGRLGVSLFILYSGLLHQYQARRRGDDYSAWQWLAKRLVRVYPLYWMGIVLALMVGAYLNGKHYAVGTIVANVLGVEMLLGLPVVTSGLGGTPLWYVNLILLCYLCFPFVCRVKATLWPFVGSVVVSGLILILYYHRILDKHLDYDAFAIAFPAFFLGMWLADRFIEGVREIPGPPAVHLIGAIVFVGLSMVFVKWKLNDAWSGWGKAILDMFGCLMLLAATVAWAICISHLWKWLVMWTPRCCRVILGGAGLSYGIYCVHEPMLAVLAIAYKKEHPHLGWLVFLVSVTLIAWFLETLSNKMVAIATEHVSALCQRK